MADIGQAILHYRKKLGLTQAALAEATGLRPSSISMYETSRRTPDEELLQKFAEVFGVSPETLRCESAEAAIQPGGRGDAVRGGDAVRAGAAAATSTTAAATQTATRTPGSGVSGPATAPGTLNRVTSLQLSDEEAKVVQFMRLNPGAAAFLQQYIAAPPERRAQIERTLQIVQAFQS